MKIKSLILALPVLCLACNNLSTPEDPASQMDANPIVAKRVSGVNMLATDFNYDQPCNLVGEEYVRETLNLEETTGLEKKYGHNGCEFVWEGNKVVISFNGDKPYTSVFTAEYMFDKLYQGKLQPVAVAPAIRDTNDVQATAGTEEGEMAETSDSTMENDEPQTSNVTATPPLTTPSIGLATTEPVRELGDKAVWDAGKGAMHVLYNNHIINVLVDTKAKAEVRKEQAMSLAEIMIDKIAKNEYSRAL